MRLFSTAEKSKKLSHILYIVFFVFGILFSASVADAATLSIVPGSATVGAGNIVTVNVVVNSEGVAINNSDAIIQFPTDLLKVISVSKSPSIFTLWVEDPNFSNTTGQVSFNGGITNPGYTGSYGQLISITFQAKKTGTASVLFSDSSVRANDGLGTDVLRAKNNATLNITAPVATPVVATPTTTAPSAPLASGLTISSATHPDQKLWYNINDAVLEWKLPSGVKTVQTAIDTNPNGIPHVSYTPAISKKEIPNIADGVSYFHVRYLTSAGWSAISTYRLQIDTVAPKDLTVSTSADQNGHVSAQMSASDSLSGIGHYSLQVDTSDPVTILPDSTTGDATSTVEVTPGTEHTITVLVFDRAGNMVQSVSTVNSSTASIPTNEIPAPVQNVQKQPLVQISSSATELLSVLVPALALLLLLLFLIYYAWHKFFRLRKHFKKDLAQAHARIHLAFKTLSEETTDQLAIIEKAAEHRKLSPAEKKAIEELHGAISQVDRYTEKLLQKIEDTDL